MIKAARSRVLGQINAISWRQSFESAIFKPMPEVQGLDLSGAADPHGVWMDCPRRVRP